MRGVMLNGGPIAVDDTGHVVTDEDGTPVVPTDGQVAEWVAWDDVGWCDGSCGECGYID